ncbi:MAG: hypothetical protein HY505_01505 [Candidatus Yanofskybacteria bacterium]|nr:hypothetical protein [Candidatus Yanofskybacteria bacterium]
MKYHFCWFSAFCIYLLGVFLAYSEIHDLYRELRYNEFSLSDHGTSFLIGLVLIALGYLIVGAIFAERKVPLWLRRLIAVPFSITAFSLFSVGVLICATVVYGIFLSIFSFVGPEIYWGILCGLILGTPFLVGSLGMIAIMMEWFHSPNPSM